MSFSQKNHFSAGHKFAFQNFWFEKEKKLFYNKRGVKKSTSIGGCQDCGEKLGKKKMGLKSVSELRHARASVKPLGVQMDEKVKKNVQKVIK